MLVLMWMICVNGVNLFNLLVVWLLKCVFIIISRLFFCIVMLVVWVLCMFSMFR